jgi:ABC-type dipeptide/oligopeptide/nickel transport system permease subunit
MSPTSTAFPAVARGPAAKAPRIALMLGYLRASHWSFRIGALLLGAIVVLIVLGPWIAPYDPTAQRLLARFGSPSGAHWLGTDHLGRDVLSRLLFGGGFGVTLAAATVAASALIGSIVGAASARAGGMIDEFAMRLVDLLIIFPDVLVALFLVAILGPGYGTLFLALIVTGWTPFARLTRALALEINSKDFVLAAEALGCSRSFIVFRHIIPNALRPISAMTFVRFGHKLITVGALSFLGLGVQPPRSDWGAMLADAQPYLERAALLGFVPGFAIFLTALAVTMLGQGLDFPSKTRRT